MFDPIKIGAKEIAVREDGTVFLVLSLHDAIAINDQEVLILYDNGTEGVVESDDDWAPKDTYALEVGNIKDILNAYINNTLKALGKDEG